MEYRGRGGFGISRKPNFGAISKYAKSNNIQLVEIWYYDLNNIEEILKERININNFESSETAGG